MEGANVGNDHNNTEFFDHFGTEFLSTGYQDAISSLSGIDDTFSADTYFTYPTGDCNYNIDQLAADEGELFLSSQEDVGRGIYYNAGTWRTIVCSPVLGAFHETEFFSMREYLMMEYISFLADIEGPELQTSASGLEYWNVLPGEDVTETLYLENIGFLDLKIWEMELEGDEFLVDIEPPVTIAGQEGIEVNITFRSNESGNFSGYLTIMSNDRDHETVVIILTAECIALPELELSETEINLELGMEIQETYPIIISNTGGSTLDYEFIPDEMINWLAIEPLNGEIPEALSATVEFNFDTAGLAVGTYTTEVSLITNDPDESELIIPVTLTVINTGNDNPGLPAVSSVNSVYPNPFNPVTSFSYSLAEAEQVKLDIYNVRGQVTARLVNAAQPAGHYNISWQPEQAGSGLYFYRFQAGEIIQSGKLILLK